MSDHTPQPTDDPETAERKSESVDERIPEQIAAPIPVIDAPGAPTMPYAGLGVQTDPVSADLGPGEAVLRQESAAQRSKIQRG
ncbi:MAG: hypothetical protein NVS9B6_09160 [Candidatus Limnocylindrales bacterium]